MVSHQPMSSHWDLTKSRDKNAKGTVQMKKEVLDDRQ